MIGLLETLPPSIPVLLIDAESTDQTAQIARAWGATVEVRAWAGFVSTRRYALRRVETPWTLMLDADEALDASLRDAIAALDPQAPFDGYQLVRSTLFCGRPIVGCGWGGERLLRLVRTDRARVEARPVSGGRSELHEALHVDGAVGELPGTLLHHSYPTFASYRAKYACYTRIEATGLTFSARSGRPS